MSTQAQRKANRQNAKKSTGPRTPEGKARSSQNALKHGLLARDAVMADEDPAEYDRQLQILEENLFPKNAIEFELVLQIADARWRLRRITRIEAGFTTYQYAGADRATRKSYPDIVLPGRNGENQLLGKSMQDHTQALHNLARYRTMTSRDITRALRMIRQLRKDEFECKENRAANGAIHRPTVTDPDPYTTPDPMEPQPPRYEPPAAAAQTSNPIGFRAESSSTQNDGNPQSRGTACRARQPGPAQNVPAQNVPVQNVAVSTGFDNNVSPARVTNHETRITNNQSPHQTRSRRNYLKTKGLSTSEALSTNYGTNRTPVAPVPSRLATEVLGR